MNSTNLTTRILTAPTLIVALLFGAFAIPATGETASNCNCCNVEDSNDCYGSPCCNIRAPRQKQPLPNQPRSSNDRSSDSKLICIDYSFGQADLNRIRRVEQSSSAPTSGSPSLIAQHVRLQI